MAQSSEKITVEDRTFELTSEKPLSKHERARVKELIVGRVSEYKFGWKENWYKTKINIYSNVNKVPEFHEVIMFVYDKITFQLPRDFNVSEETIYIKAPIIIRGSSKTLTIKIQQNKGVELIPCIYPRGYEITLDYPTLEDLKLAEALKEAEVNT